MTADPMCPSRETRKVMRPAAGAVELQVGAQRRDHWEPCIMPVQRVGHAMVDGPAAAAEYASLATSRWCWSRDCRRRATSGHPCCCCRCCCRSHRSCCSCLSLSPCPCLCHRCWGWGHEGEGAPDNMAVPTAVGTEAVAIVEGALHLRAQSRTQRPVLGPLSGPAQSPQV
jgi:hypothetical protein